MPPVQVSQLNSLLHELDCVLLRRLATECGGEAAEGELSCTQHRLQIEVSFPPSVAPRVATNIRIIRIIRIINFE